MGRKSGITGTAYSTQLLVMTDRTGVLFPIERIPSIVKVGVVETLLRKSVLRFGARAALQTIGDDAMGRGAFGRALLAGLGIVALAGCASTADIDEDELRLLEVPTTEPRVASVVARPDAERAPPDLWAPDAHGSAGPAVLAEFRHADRENSQEYSPAARPPIQYPTHDDAGGPAEMRIVLPPSSSIHEVPTVRRAMQEVEVQSSFERANPLRASHSTAAGAVNRLRFGAEPESEVSAGVATTISWTPRAFEAQDAPVQVNHYAVVSSEPPPRANPVKVATQRQAGQRHAALRHAALRLSRYDAGLDSAAGRQSSSADDPPPVVPLAAVPPADTSSAETAEAPAELPVGTVVNGLQPAGDDDPVHGSTLTIAGRMQQYRVLRSERSTADEPVAGRWEPNKRE
jgi:hypothetical protein